MSGSDILVLLAVAAVLVVLGRWYLWLKDL